LGGAIKRCHNSVIRWRRTPSAARIAGGALLTSSCPLCGLGALRALALKRTGQPLQRFSIMRTLTLAAALLLISNLCSLTSRAATIDTIAGTGQPENNDDAGQATKTNINQPFGVEIGPDGALYICEIGHHRVRRLDLKSGELTTVAGNGTKGYGGDGGPATEAQLNEPYEVRFDSNGNMLFVEMQNHLVRKVDAKTGSISTVAGTGKAGFGGDGGPALKAQFSSPHSIALDQYDNIYVADIGNHRIRRVHAKSGIVTTIAGNGERKLPTDGETAAVKPMIGPRALFVQEGTLWIALREGHSVWRMDLANRVLRHVAGTGQKGFSGDGGPAKDATFDGPKGIALDRAGNIYVVDTENHAIRKLDSKGGQITTLAGQGPEHQGAAGDGGPATSATMDRPHGICVGPDGAVYIGDSNNHRVRRVK
jgi:streptogramin lyase